MDIYDKFTTAPWWARGFLTHERGHIADILTFGNLKSPSGLEGIKIEMN
jgi:hypothetical protein